MVSTNLTEQISKRFTGDSRRDFKKNPGHVCTASACYAINLLVCLNIEQKHDMHNMGAMAKIKRATSFLNKQFHHDWKTNAVNHQHFTQKFPGGPYKFKDISRISRKVFKLQ